MSLDSVYILGGILLAAALFGAWLSRRSRRQTQ